MCGGITKPCARYSELVLVGSELGVDFVLRLDARIEKFDEAVDPAIRDDGTLRRKP